MQGIIRLRSLSAKHWDYYFTAQAHHARPLNDWGIVRLDRHHSTRILREPYESFIGEGELILHHGTRFLASHLLRGKHVWKVHFDS